MNDSELESRLKGVPVPERSDEYWKDFPSQVRVELYRKNRPIITPPSVWRPRLVWAGGLAVALTMAFVCIQYHPLKTASSALTKNQQHLKAQMSQLDAGLHVLLFNTQDMSSVVTEPN